MRNIFILLIVFVCSCNSAKKDEVNLELIPVSKDDYWGYIDGQGKLVINYQFKNAYTFSEGLALVRSNDNKFGFIDKKGNWAIKAIYKDALAFSEGLALVVKENTQLEYINTAGETKVTLMPDVENAMSFSEDLALVTMNDLFGYVNKKGELIIPTQFEVASPFKEGLAAAKRKTDASKKSEEQWGFIDKKGVFAIEPQFESVEAFKNGLAVVKTAKKYGFIDKKGKYTIQPSFDYASSFEDEYALSRMGDLFGFIDKKGNWVINAQFKNVNAFSGNSLTTARSNDDTWSIIDKQGKFINQQKFESASRFFGSIAIVEMGDKYGFIDKSGKLIINPQYDRIMIAKDDNYWVTSDYFDMQGTISFILKETSATAFSGFSETMTYKSLKTKYPNLSETNFYAFSDFEAQKNQSISLSTIGFSFKEGLFSYKDNYTMEQVYDAPSGGYISKRVYQGSTPTLNEATPLQGVTLAYTLLKKASGKSKEIMAELAKNLKQQYQLTDEPKEAGYEYSLKNQKYSVKIATSGSIIRCEIFFGPRPAAINVAPVAE